MGYPHLRHGRAIDAHECAGYSWASHQTNLRLMAEADRLPPFAGWSIEAACRAPMPVHFDDLLRELEDLKSQAVAEGLDPEVTLPERVATVSMWNVGRTDLEPSERRGAGWVCIPTGMTNHGWEFRNADAYAVVYRAEFDFFDRHCEVASLARLLHSCYVMPDDHRFRERVRFRALLDRREHEQILRQELSYRPVRALDTQDRLSSRSTRSKPSKKKRKKRV